MRIATAVLAGVSMMGLAACGDDKAATTTAEPAKPAATSALPEAEAAAPAAAAPADKVICEDANKAAESFKKALLTIMSTTGGDVPKKDAALMLSDFAANLEKAAEGSDTAVATALKTNAAEAAKAAKADDPVNAADTPESAKAAKEFNAACKAVGVKTNL
ncbi:hypothetical protein KZ829_08035 [Actinoplanes hulinensis]|uniref:Lipoprotein n=1 Tax=Actinoplanes hulinensis TaxID=1144547 RepID=A0ABS7AY55_9ACTN|nr:hypothetical protein [Actinoplanes hulinensis]MBW6433691.1 hypothetical protein [Actinoplanes hulinensis]